MQIHFSHKLIVYIYFRALKLALTVKQDASLGVWDEIQTPMVAWPTDIDVFMEVNNGRYLTLMDIGRFEYGVKIGLIKALKRRNWGLVVAGSSIRYRKRIHAFQRFCIHTRVVGIDERWVYFQHVIKRHGKWHAAALVRTAVTDQNGVVATREVAEELSMTSGEQWEYRMPDWVKQWDTSDQMRPWETDKED